MESPSPIQIAVLGLALVFGVALFFSFRAQLQLQRRAIAGDSKASLLNRLTMAGLSMSILFGAILAAKALSGVVSKDTFIISAFIGFLAALVARLRSNSTQHRTRV